MCLFLLDNTVVNTVQTSQVPVRPDHVNRALKLRLVEKRSRPKPAMILLLEFRSTLGIQCNVVSKWKTCFKSKLERTFAQPRAARGSGAGNPHESWFAC